MVFAKYNACEFVKTILQICKIIITFAF